MDDGQVLCGTEFDVTTWSCNLNDSHGVIQVDEVQNILPLMFRLSNSCGAALSLRLMLSLR
jgi:hypothetical protein